MKNENERYFSIAGRPIGPQHPPYIIAELSANHNGSLERAIDILKFSKDAGVDAIKLQTYTADTLTIDHHSVEFMIKGGLWGGMSLYELYDKAHTPWEWHPILFEEANKLGLTIFSTPFDRSAVRFLESLSVPAYKIASFEAVDLSLVRDVAQTGKPMIISTGMTDWNEIQAAVEAARAVGNEDVALLHCVSAYPAPVDQSNLATIAELSATFDVVAGLSDHTLGTTVSVCAVARGANIIERHVTASRQGGGPDDAFSLEPHELKELVAHCQIAWRAGGEVKRGRQSAEKSSLVFRRSLYVVQDVEAGEQFNVDNLRSIRPGYGLAPKHYDEVLGCRAVTQISRGTPLAWNMIETLS